jgi:hypothetical protein
MPKCGRRSEVYLALHGRFHLFRRVRQLLGEIDELSGSVDVEGIFDADAYLLFGNVEARLDGEHRTDHEGLVVVIWIVHIDADGMPERVDEIFPQRFAVEVFAVGVDVVEGDLVEQCDLGSAPRWSMEPIFDLPATKASRAACWAPSTML